MQFDEPNPFDEVPSSPPVATHPPATPSGGASPGPRRGRMAAAGVAAAGLIGAGVLGVAQLTSAEPSEVDTEIATDASDRPTGASVAALLADAQTAVADDVTDSDDAEPAADGDDDGDQLLDGEIVLDLGDGDPIVIDLGDLDADALTEFRECAGLSDFGRPFDLELGPGVAPNLGELFGDLDAELEDWIAELGELELPEFEGGILTGPGNHITVFGPDGPQVIDLGDGDATVTITQEDGELTITTDGDASVGVLPDIFGGELPELGDFDLGELDLEQLFDELELGELPLDELGDLPFGDWAIELPDANLIEDCLDRIG